MNFLAHIYLSGDNDQIKVGNFIGDFIKGHQFMEYPTLIRKGILLHRNIDHFTDNSPIAHQAKLKFVPKFRHYSGIIVDMVYDHILAKEWHQYSCVEMEDFVNDFHNLVLNNMEYIPHELKINIPRLIKNQRLLKYRTIDGLENSLTAMTNYTSLPDYINYAINIVNDDYNFFSENFNRFFIKIIKYIKNVHNIELNLSCQDLT